MLYHILFVPIFLIQYIISGVPFLRQKVAQCGPAALTSVYNYYGVAVDQDEVSADVYSVEIHGSLITDMARDARNRGFHTEMGYGNTEWLVQQIQADKPPILLIEQGVWIWSIPHYIVAYGVDGENILVRDGRTPDRVISLRELDRKWRSRQRLYLILEPMK